MSASRTWLEWLYGQEPLGLIWIGGQRDNFQGRTFTSLDDAIRYAESIDVPGSGAPSGVYHRLTTLRSIERGRGAAGDSAYLPAFGMDLDLKGPGHKALNYPETDDDLRDLLRKAGLPEPTAWVHSGGGRYPFWKMEQAIDLTIPGELKRASDVSKRLHTHVIEWAGEMGWKVDNTSDLARVYRLPGTTNRKVPDDLRVCHVLEDSGPMYSPEDLEYALSNAPTPHSGSDNASPFLTSSAVETRLFSDTDTSHLGHVFTLEQALTFVRPALDALRGARDGEINVKLVSAAMTLAHFGAEFWDREAAERQLNNALAATVYDGATWQAQDTIDRAYRDMGMKTGPEYWRATLVKPTLDTPQPAGGRLRRAMLKRSAVHSLPDPVPLIEEVLYKNSVTVLAGKFGTYKSFIAISWAAALATGQDWFGHHTPRPVAVIYAAAEGAYGLKKRMSAWKAKYGQIPDNLYLIPVSVRINRPEDMAELEEIITEVGAEALVFDTLHASTPGVDENDAGEMGKVMDVLRGLQERHGLCAILPHHTGHAGERARGSSSVEDDADVTFVVRLAGEDRGPNSTRTLVHRKTKDGALLPDVDLKLTLVPEADSGYVEPATGDAYGDEAARLQAASGPEEWELKWAEAQRQILRVLVDQGGEVGLTKAEVRQSVADRWHGGVRGRDKGLRDSTFHTAWTRTLELLSPDGEDNVVLNVRGEKYAVDRVALAAHEGQQKVV